MNRAAGVLFHTPVGLALFLRRSQDGDHAGEWCLPGGGVEQGETAQQAAIRECREEVGYEPTAPKPLDRRLSKEDVDFTTFHAPVAVPFAPVLNAEHSTYLWAPLQRPPQPLHPGVAATLAARLQKPAMDRAVRHHRQPAKTLPAVLANAGLQAAYRRRLDLLLGEMHNSVLYWVSAAYKANEPEMAQDASPAATMRALMAKLRRHWLKRFNAAAPELAAYFAQAVDKRTSAALRQILKDAGVSVAFKMTAQANDVLSATTGENVALIKSIGQQYLTDVEGAVMRSVAQGRDLKALADEIGGRVDLARIGMGRKPGESDKSLLARTRRRVALIARDQNNKATATLTRVRQTEAGIEEAIWMHSSAGKEPRPTHVTNDGERYKINEGWYDPAAQKHIWPGTEINCRCFSKSVIPGL